MTDNTTVSRNTETGREEATLLPPVDVIEDALGITVYADMPGVSRDGLHLQIEAGTLSIEGRIGLEMPAGMTATHAEVKWPHYRRAFTLSKELDGEQITAGFEQGVLTLRIPKVKHAQPRRVEIKVL